MKITKLKDFYKVILKGTALFCPFCKSIEVVHSNYEKVEDDEKLLETYDVICSKCGAKAKVNEEWQKHKQWLLILAKLLEIDNGELPDGSSLFNTGYISKYENFSGQVGCSLQ